MKKILIFVLFCVLTNFAYANNLILLSPFPAGGPADRILRVIEQHLKDNNINSVIEYRPGAGGLIAANYLAKTQKNILMLPGISLFTSQHITGADVQYDILKDFNLVHVVGMEPTVLVAKKSSKITINDILNKPLNSGTPGVGTSSHIASLIIKNKNPNTILVPFKGEKDQLLSLLGGHVDWAISSEKSVFPHIQNNTLTPILTWTPNRIYANVPTAKELGINDRNFYRIHILISNKNFDKNILETVKSILKDQAFDLSMKEIGILNLKVNEDNFLKLENDKINLLTQTFNINE